ncbi:hypothetical protein E2C00_01435 [Streptomyces sp. WAC05374]|uniref:hypothetical protein n=1 Tax=Streptomyces sp. WAC05374 TaxID=2487420 RepID=UPI000F86F0AD|nr:hypothetical protein [Streptomyces sp. WAC05374]RST17545.1 hypothetical protein EF905_09060 [Streptomyces sp. WAC05374]TDF50203.1 hypothetical protein E2B92_01410 [Streptomyces sp. WAC05374]TDF57928.1 hypothetical protein E2C02_09200 [Streptomyces sp. WAC05374]TDF60457.1 hypothetical protein E2C00_01435 [Streptomyces sp. WAC05374]
MPFPMTVRWRRAKEAEHFLLKRRSQGGPADGSVEVAVTALDAREVLTWSDPAVGRPCTPVGTPSHTDCSFTVPDTAAALRLTFSVRLRVGGHDEEALTVTQRLTVGARGRLVPDAYEVPRYRLTVFDRGGNTEVRQKVPHWAPGRGVRGFFGHHPLLEVTGGSTVEVDTEFLDVTNLWWALHFRTCPNNVEAGFNPWYLEPTANPRPARLRVLVSTRVTPVLWFATLPEAAGGQAAPPDKEALPDGTTVGGYVFFRPVASAYAYPSTGMGALTEPLHATKGMRNLCRFLLQGHNRADKGRITGLPDWHQLIDHSTGTTNPLGAYGALPCGMEYALDRTAPRLLAETRSLRVLLMPVPDSQYGTAKGPGNAGRVSAALRLLWTLGLYGGVGQQLLRTGEPQPLVAPQPGATAPARGTLRVADDVWVGGFSSGGHALWELLGDAGNRATTGRALVFDTVDWRLGQQRLLATAKARGKRLQVRIVWSPYSMGEPTEAFLKGVRAPGSQVAVWPRAGATYYQHPPNPDNAWAEYVFADAKPWKNDMFPGKQMAEWWHQFVVFAGDELHGDPRHPSSVGFMEASMTP